VAPQSIPAGELVTVPEPDPDGCRVTVYCGGGASMNVAVTALLEVSDTLQVPVPEQAPLHPLKTFPDPGVAARLTDVPDA